MKKVLFLLCTAFIVSGFTSCFDNNDCAEIEEATVFQSNSDETKNIEDEVNSGEIWSSDEFLMKFENFQEELSYRLTFDLGLDYPHDDGRAEEHIENYLKRAGTPAAIYLVWKAHKLEAALGTEFEKAENSYTGYDYIIPKDTVMNVIEQYGIDESKIDWSDFRDYDENSDYFIVPDGFSGMYIDREILYDTLVYSPDTNIVTLDITFYSMGSERQFELCTFKYKFEPFLYKDKIWCYKFIDVELISRG